ncbi:hypothetical protein BRARA_I02102 [Brassica rapa]|uniref:Uncharacterized protein n=1 Tax=Brassica campestris TaxID=3711 RepID=A0A397XXS0_BRACM|nr:hypothetical protein BRARA_I02102 [Brassica rapa]
MYKVSGSVRQGVVYTLASSSCSLLWFSPSIHDLSCDSLSTRSAHPRWRVVGFWSSWLVAIVSYRSATFQVEEPSSCSKRWSEWAFVVIHKCPELQPLHPSIGVLISTSFDMIPSFFLLQALHLIRRPQFNLVLAQCWVNLSWAFAPVTSMNFLDLV